MSSSQDSSLPPLPPIQTENDSDSEQSVGSNNEPIHLVNIPHPKFNDMYKIDQNQRGRANKVNINWNDSLEALKALDELPETNNAWIACKHSKQTLKRLFPKIKKSKFDTDYNNYKLLFCFMESARQNEDVYTIHLKGAVQHRVTGKITMLSATNVAPLMSHYTSQDDGWYVYKADMNAPACFWNAFKAC